MLRLSRPYLYLLPAAAVLGLFHLFPLLAVIWISAHKDWGTAGAAYVGAANYQHILHSGEFQYSLGVTLWYAAGTIPVTIGSAVLFAVLLYRKMPHSRVFRVLYFLPYITSTVAAAAVWKWILHVDQRGLANAFLGMLGSGPFRFTEQSGGVFELLVGHGLPVVGAGPSLALVSVMVFAVWHTFGFYVIVLTAGLAQIPKETYEAAALDGAGGGRMFVSITLPQLRPVLGFLVVISTIAAFQTFNQIYVMAPSERLDTARNVTMYIVTEFWDNNRFGPAAAASVMLFVILVALTIVQLRFYRRKD